MLKYKCPKCGREWGRAWRFSSNQRLEQCSTCSDNLKGVRHYEATLGTVAVRFTAKNMEQALKKAEKRLCRFRQFGSPREDIIVEHIRKSIHKKKEPDNGQG